MNYKKQLNPKLYHLPAQLTDWYAQHNLADSIQQVKVRAEKVTVRFEDHTDEWTFGARGWKKTA